MGSAAGFSLMAKRILRKSPYLPGLQDGAVELVQQRAQAFEVAWRVQALAVRARLVVRVGSLKKPS